MERLEDRCVPAFAISYSLDGGSSFTTVADNGAGDTNPALNGIGANIGPFSLTASSSTLVSVPVSLLTLTFNGQAAASSYDIVILASVTDVTTAPAPQTLSYGFTGSVLPSNGASTMETWVDNGDALFGTTGGGIAADTGSQSVSPQPEGSFAFTGNVPYSVTTEIKANFVGPASVSLDSGNAIVQASVKSPLINTIAGGPVAIGSGNKLTDTAMLSGGSNPTGNITFTLTGPGNQVVDTETVTVTGDANYATPNGYLPLATGTYVWSATYSGDSNNASATDNGVNETENVDAINTSQTPAIAFVGESIADTATVTGLVSPTSGDTVTFNLYNNNSASGTPLFTDTETISVNGSTGTATSKGYTAATSGTDYWVATFNGDNNNAAVTSVPTAEPVNIDSINTSQQPAYASVGTSIADQATVTGASPTGKVVFNLYSSATTQNSSTLLFTDTESLNSSGVATSAGYTATATGTDYWVATYNGDSNNAAVTSSATAEPVNIDTINTSQQPANASVGSSIADKATVTGNSPTGKVVFNLYSSGTTQNSSTLLFTDTETLSGGVATSAGYTATATGTDYWVATYNGDSNNAAVTSSATAEPVTITPLSPSINTTPGGTVTIGSMSISGVKFLDATGNGFSSDDAGKSGVTINLYQETNNSSGLQVGSGGDKLMASTTTGSNGAYSFNNLSPGTYYVQEVVPSGYIQTGGGTNGSAGNTYYTVNATNGHSYTGVNFDDFLIPTCNEYNVCYKVTTPGGYSQTYSTLSGNTQQGDTVTVTFTIPSGENDTLTLVSYYAPGASFSDSTAYQQAIYQQATGTFGPGTHSLTVQIPNTYYQIDFVCGSAISQLEPNQDLDAYGPDAANILYHGESRYDSSDNGGTTTTPHSNLNSTPPATPTVTTTSAVTAPMTDSATISGGFNPTGTVTFYLLPPGSTSSTPLSSAVYKDVVTIGTNSSSVTGNGTYTTSMGNMSGGFVPTVAGTYNWVAVYSGDSNNGSVTSAFGSEPETATGTSNVTVVKTADSSSITAGQTAGFTVVITNTGSATATGVTLDDPLPAGLGKDVKWTIDSSKGNPADFQINGSVGSQDLVTASSFNGQLAAGASITVHITAATFTDDLSSMCGVQSSIPCNFNGTSLSGGNYLWFNCNVNVPNLCTTQSTTINCTGQNISFNCGGKTYNVAVPDCTITFSPNCTSATTSYNSQTGQWNTCVPVSGLSGNDFLCGAPFQIPTGGLSGGIQNVTWTGNFSDNANCKINWQWAAACYTNFNGNCANLNVKPCDDTKASQYKNSDHCGTPENYTSSVCGGATGGGGSNCTGSYSSTCSVTPPTMFCGTGTLPNTATVNANGQTGVQSSATITLSAPSTPVGPGAAATIGYWHNKNGQALITGFNGSANSTALGNWLASNFPNLFGSFKGQTNTQVASDFLNAFGNVGGVQGNTYAQTFAVALAVYATDPSLGGGSAASGQGFTVKPGGTGSDTVNIGSNGAAFGVSNNATLTVLQVLQILNSNYNPTSQQFFGGSQSNTSLANNVTNGINQGGDIANANMTGSGLEYTPAQIRAAYGIDKLSLDGTGQTIAIVDAFDDPSIFQSLDTFDSRFGLTNSGPSLYDQYGPASSFLTVLNQNGSASSLPTIDPNGAGTDNWEVEVALDVEWAHAIAPGAQIVLVEANSPSLPDLMASVATAGSQPGVSVVSMSWGFTEGLSVQASDEATYDKTFTTPGVTFIASTGDYGTANPEYPAFSPNVVAVGGSSLLLNANGSYQTEAGWGSYSNATGVLLGSGGGLSQYESEPYYQEGVQTTGFRSTPDVSFIADPNTGAWVADTYNLPTSSPWEVVGGTSLAAPAWSGIMALINQGRVSSGKATLNTATSTEAQQALYTLSQNDFNQIASGSNGGYQAGGGYNLVTGLGTPIANVLVSDMIAYTWTDYTMPNVNAAEQAAIDGSKFVESTNYLSESASGANAVFSALLMPTPDASNASQAASAGNSFDAVRSIATADGALESSAVPTSAAPFATVVTSNNSTSQTTSAANGWSFQSESAHSTIGASVAMQSAAFAANSVSDHQSDGRASTVEYLAWLNDTAGPSDAASQYMNAIGLSESNDADVLDGSNWISLSGDGVAVATGVFDDLASALSDD